MLQLENLLRRLRVLAQPLPGRVDVGRVLRRGPHVTAHVPTIDPSRPASPAVRIDLAVVSAKSRSNSKTRTLQDHFKSLAANHIQQNERRACRPFRATLQL